MHLDDHLDFACPYELREEEKLSDKELLEKITRERGLTGESVAGIVGVIQQGVDLQQERYVCAGSYVEHY